MFCRTVRIHKKISYVSKSRYLCPFNFSKAWSCCLKIISSMSAFKKAVLVSIYLKSSSLHPAEFITTLVWRAVLSVIRFCCNHPLLPKCFVRDFAVCLVTSPLAYNLIAKCRRLQKCLILFLTVFME